MTDQSKPKPEQRAKIEHLELNKETVQDLTESESEQAKGGLRRAEKDTIFDITCQGC